MVGVPWRESIDVEQAADEVRKSSGQLKAPIDPAVIAQKLGIAVFRAQFNDDTVSGIFRKTVQGYDILVNASHPVNRIRYTIAHEIGHFCLHKDLMKEFVDRDTDFYRQKDSDANPSNNRIEVQANMFGAALLMPIALIRDAWNVTHSVPRLAELFLVSESAMKFRIANLDLA
jgi:Zn-dependent peptidase ImmA (M78 family)